PLSKYFDSSKPIFIQVRERIEDQIVNNQLKEGDQAPSTNQLVNFYKINHATVSKGINLLVESGVLYRIRGLGTLVAERAKEKLIQARKRSFMDDYVLRMMQEADKLGTSDTEIIDLIKNFKGRDIHDA